MAGGKRREKGFDRRRRPIDEAQLNALVSRLGTANLDGRDVLVISPRESWPDPVAFDYAVSATGLREFIRPSHPRDYCPIMWRTSARGTHVYVRSVGKGACWGRGALGSRELTLGSSEFPRIDTDPP